MIQSDQKILTEEHGAVLLVILNRPLKRNAITLSMYRQLHDVLKKAQERNDVRVVVIAGQKGMFCAGNDLNDFAQTQGDEHLQPIHDFVKFLAAFDKPLFAAVDGAAVGIGLTLLLHCDFIIATPEARFSSAFTDLALVPEAASSLLAPLVMGYQNAFELLVMGETFDAKRAHEVGLVNRIIPFEALHHEALRAAQGLARKSVESVRLSRRLLKLPSDVMMKRMDEEFALFLTRLDSDEVRAAIAKFFRKA